METSAPDIVTSPDSRGVEDQLEPEDPADVVESQGDKHVGVQSDARTPEGGEPEEDQDGEEETDQGYSQADRGHGVDCNVKFCGLIVQTGAIVGPGPAIFPSQLSSLTS